jgi:hypothetical protein
MLWKSLKKTLVIVFDAENRCDLTLKLHTVILVSRFGKSTRTKCIKKNIAIIAAWRIYQRF